MEWTGGVPKIMACRAEKLEAIAQKKVHGTQLRLSMVLENQTYWRIKIVW